MTLRLAAAFAACLLSFLPARAADPAALTAADLAAKLSTLREDGSTFIRLKLEIKPASGEKTILQVQIKGRHTKAASDVVYQVLWPKERKGEAILLHKTGDRAATGSIFLPATGVRTLEAGQMKDALLGTDLCYEDVIDNFFAWDQQILAGTETIDRVPCQILESKPGKGERSSYASVRTWIDTKRFLPLRIEKFNSSGQLIRRITTTDVVKQNDRYLPATLAVQGPRKDSISDFDGSKIKFDVTYTDRDFTVDALKALTAPRAE
jgi:hypothetical protein